MALKATSQGPSEEAPRIAQQQQWVSIATSEFHSQGGSPLLFANDEFLRPDQLADEVAISPEVADLVWAAIQEMEGLARNCILVEDSYHWYFMRNCGAQEEEVAWRQQGEREEACAWQAADDARLICRAELSARAAHYNFEAVQRNNLFRLLLKLEHDSLASVPRDQAVVKGAACHKKPRRLGLPSSEILGPTAFPTDTQARRNVTTDEVKLLPSPLAAQQYQTALVHNPYSFHGPSHVMMGFGNAGALAGGVGLEAPTVAPPPPIPSASGLSAVLRHWNQMHGMNKPSPAAMYPRSPGPHTEPKSPLGRRGGLPGRDVDSVSMPWLQPHHSPVGIRRPVTDLPWETQRQSSPVARSYPSGPLARSPVPHLHNVLLMEAGYGQRGQGLTTAPPERGRHQATKRGGGRGEDDTTEDHGLLLTYPTCTHVKSWKRLRANRGFAYFICTGCGVKWRVSSKGVRTQNMAALETLQTPQDMAQCASCC